MHASDVSGRNTAGAAPPAEAGEVTGVWVWAALAVALVAAAGSLFLSLGLGLRACPLCFYQRTFMLSLVGVLGMGLVFGRGRRLGTVALPLAVAGLGVASFHVYLEVAGALECPPGVLGMGTAPAQSLAAFVPLVVLLAVDILRLPGAGRWPAFFGGVVLGGLLAVASCVANPPPPAPPQAPYTRPPDICRPPFHPQH